MLKNNLKKIDIIKNLSKKTGYSINYSKKIINELIGIIFENLKTDNFNLKGLGSFKIISKRERLGRNPKTKEEFLISARKTISFKPSKKLSDVLKSRYE